MGLRVISCLAGRYRVFASTRTAERAGLLRRAGAMPIVADLDDPAAVGHLGGLAPLVVHLAPPQGDGVIDRRTRRLLPLLHGVRRLVYVSTTGVYGDCGGAWIDETRAVAPQTDRARRRVDAEDQLRRWARRTDATLTILRVPGIYAGDRLPLARLAQRTPVLVEYEDVFTNHIHADDLARVIVRALHVGTASRVFNAVDDSAMRMGDWFDLLADTHGLERPERVSRTAIASRIAPMLLSFMSESRRLSNARMLRELGVRLAHPTVREGVAAAIRPAP